ncbi:MAG: Asp-tRNA(Asn)/Glu-tRNA(Gln) amidotransferase subunit GatB [Candidatus Aenigmarchaeota archaeon]|nr:Asp-tRNA(Asn)/Glu-tRNA(Gln) amidotransferase subunit GatB [Candidatus Aenigmarchaeota archaeon]
MKIGLEVHVQLNTKTKLFCGCPNKFVNEPNTQTCEYCIGLPGSKPRLNEKAVEQAMKIATALNCKMPEETYFSRKTYFYPDMGKNFQITQYEMPIASDGFMKIANNKIKITRIQIEEDPARIVHASKYNDEEHVASITTADYTLLDYNRSGVPLCEIVTEPVFASAREARIFLQEMSTVLQYLDVYNPDVEGSMRVDANISVGAARVEIKNISGYREVEKALNYEIIRQKSTLRRGGIVTRETRSWDAITNVTRPLRTKEEAEDYGYIFEADLPRITITKQKIADVKKSIPEMAEEKLERYVKKLKIGLDLAMAIVAEPDLAGMFETVVKQADTQIAAKWFAGEIKKTLNYSNLHIKDSKLKAEHIIKLLKLVEKKTVTESTAELILREMIVRPEDPELLLNQENATRIYNEDILQPIVEQTLGENAQAILDYKAGKKEAINFLVGQTMKKTHGRGDSETIRRIILKLLNG